MRASDIAERAEIAVLGAGIAGLTTALRLAQAGRSVVVIDQSEPFRGGSGVNAGTLALQNKSLTMLPFFKEAVAEWRRLADELDGDVGYVRAGGLRVAASDDDVEALSREVARQTDLGVETEWLEGSDLRARAPWLAPQIVSATYCAGDGFASPLLAGRALVKAVAAAGVRVLSRARFLGQTRLADGYRLETSAGPIACECAVIAAGAWSQGVAALFGAALPVECRVNMLSVTERMPRFMDNLVVTHIAGRLTLKQFPNGTCVLGGGWRGRGGVDSGRKDLDCDRLRENLRLHAGVVPRLKPAAILRSWAGFAAETADRWPVSGGFGDHPHLFAAVPVSAGFTAAALVGRLTAERMISGQTPPLAEAMAPDRFVQ